MLLRHAAFNLIGLGAPLVVAVASIPILIYALGAERFGLLTLLWAVVGYFGLFDLGLGRALTQQLAAIFATNAHERVGPLVATGVSLTAMLGVAGGALLAITAEPGVDLIRSVPNRDEVLNAIYVMASTIPVIVVTSAFRGILEARHAFGAVNLIRLPMGLYTFVAPVAVVLYGQPRLDWIAWALAVGRLIGCVAHAFCAWRLLPRTTHGSLVPQLNYVKPLCISGGWLTISNIISPFMGYVDRFVIGTMVSTSAVAYYATPNELVTKLWIVPGALTAVLFPTFAAQIVARATETRVLFGKAVHWLFVVLLPITVGIALFAHDLLTVWIDRDFADHSAIVLQIFAVGILINCLAHVPFTLVQGAGAARTTALIHTAELPLFLLCLWWLTLTYGIVGAAIAWLVRMVVDAALMFGFCTSILGYSTREWFKTKVLLFAALGLLGFGGLLLQPFTARAAWVVGIMAAAALTLVLSRGPKRAE